MRVRVRMWVCRRDSESVGLWVCERDGVDVCGDVRGMVWMCVGM